MKVVLRHNLTGRYYRAPSDWVRRADNALAFEDLPAAKEFLRTHHLDKIQTVYRLAPFLMPLLHPQLSIWETWMHARRNRWNEENINRFMRN
ncbi:MAG TPA: hypothetical protein VNT99_17565 [Methylomirabilota bacterium]|nr:hypothetical protein [Methylomirabilota bacterium]